MTGFKSIYRYFLILILAVCVDACRKPDIPDIPDGDARPIAFEEVGTKTIFDSSNLPESFFVWGETSAGQANVFAGVEVTGDNASGWNYSGDKKYWALYSDYDFYAVAPDGYPMTFTDGEWGIDYEMPVKISADLEADTEAHDIIVAKHERTTGDHSTAIETAPVSFNFEHILSRVKIVLSKSSENADETMMVNQVYLGGLFGSGTYKFSSGWSLKQESSGAYIAYPDPGTELHDGGVELTVGEFFVPPQTLSAEQVFLLVAFTYDNGSGSSQKYSIMPVPVNTVSEWEPAKGVTYKAVISVDHDIIFETPTVESWGTEQTGGTIIIK